MKFLKTLIIAIIAFTCNMGNAQTVNGSPIDEIDVQYVEIVGASKAFSSKLNIQIDFGQEVKFLKASKNTVIKDKEGKI